MSNKMKLISNWEVCFWRISALKFIVIVINIIGCARELLEMEDWSDWDFLLNLSESDYPVKTQQELVEFLTNNRSMRFSF